MGAIRLFLACCVVLGHLNEQVLSRIGLGIGHEWIINFSPGRAVIFFYVVSGFLMSYVLATKYPPTSAGTVAFYRARALRIFPLWWIVLIVGAAVGSATSIGALLPAAVLVGSDWIVPFWNYPANYWGIFPFGTGVGWTLGAELAFYLMAPFVLRRWKVALGLLLASCAIRVAVFAIFPDDLLPQLTWAYFFFPATLMYFLLGHFARVIGDRIALGLPASLALVATALVATYLSNVSQNWQPPHLAIACFALALPGLFRSTKDSRLMNFFGDLTYSLYLTHALLIAAIFFGSYASVGQAIIDASNTHGGGALIFAAGLAIALVAAALAHVLVETPIMFTSARRAAWRSARQPSSLPPPAL